MSVVKLALTGKLRAGKDSVADYLVDRYGFRRVAFADALKRFAHEIFPWVPETPKPRALYQSLGQAVRTVDESVWVRHALAEVDRLTAQGYSVVVTDLRQPNEFEALRAAGFTIVRVTAPDEVRIARALAAGDDFTVHDLAHETELHVDAFAVDYEIDNSGSLEWLQTQIDVLLAD
jgi:dephospho-CoA kinase